MDTTSSRWLSMEKTKLDSVEELINLKRYRLPFWNTLLNSGLRSAAGRHLESAEGSHV